MMNVISRLRADLPQRLLLLERLHDRFAIEHRARPQRIRGQHGHGRGVVEEMAHERLLFAVAPVLGPVLDDARVRIDEPAIDQHVEADRRDAFGDRHHADGRRRVPWHAHLARSRQPPQMSTTVRPSSTTEQAAPTSSSTLKFSTNASTTARYSGA